MSDAAAPADPDAPAIRAWTPLRHPVYRNLWIAWIAACLTLWMNDVAAAWLMASLTASPVMVALVQTAAALPVFLLGLPAGALADIFDRRRLLIFTQAWAVLVAVLLFVLALGGALDPTSLLVLVFANGIVLALRWPAFSAIVPDLVPHREIPAASALNGVANNGSRLAGPLLAGVVIAAAGSAYVFGLNALLSLLSATLLVRWSAPARTSALPGERFVGAMRLGIQHVRQSTRMHCVLLHVAIFFLNMIAVVALLPLVAKRLDGGAGAYAMMMAGLGAGAVAGAFALPRVNRRLDPERRFAAAALMYAAATAGVALAPGRAVVLVAMFCAGAAFMVAGNTLIVAATMALPQWVRARGLAIYQMVMMGASAAGAAWWGWIASVSSVRAALLGAAATMAFGLLASRRVPLPIGSGEETRPAGQWSSPDVALDIAPEQGPVLVTVEYRIDPDRTDEFLALMRESRRVWLGHGLAAWSLFSNVSEEGCHIEHMVDESWAAYLRRNERVAASYLSLRERKRAMHRGPGMPIVARYVGRSVER